MNITVISTCTGSKANSSNTQLTLDDFRQGWSYVAQRTESLQELVLPAAQMYTGEQHVRLMRGVRKARLAGHSVDVWIVSAGYGVLAEDAPTAPYEATFNDIKRKEDRVEWAATLGIPQRLREILQQKADFALVLLSDRYLEIAGLERNVRLGCPTWGICGSASVKRFSPAFHLVTLREPDTRRYNAGMTGLKGAVAATSLSNPDQMQYLTQLGTA